MVLDVAPKTSYENKAALFKTPRVKTYIKTYLEILLRELGGGGSALTSTMLGAGVLLAGNSGFRNSQAL
jgi:hypothetical protein